MTVYLTQRPDPQRRGKMWAPDDDVVVRTWIRSLQYCGLMGIIFHDGLSPDFTAKWDSEDVMFWPITWKTPWTAAEERVQIYLDWLHDFPCDWVCTTDLADVEFYRDPFEVIHDPNMLYIGSETETIGEVVILQQWMTRTYGEITDKNRVILNPGIVGGSYYRIVDFLRRWLAEMGRAIEPTQPPHDIVAFNRLIYREQIPFVTGPQLHTIFRAHEGPESGAAIRHK